MLSSPTSSMARDVFVVVGAGITGLGCAYLLSQQHRVILIESEERPGGHAQTHSINLDGYPPLAIDTGFIVFNSQTYPDLVSLFETLGVEVENSSMSFAASVEMGPGGLFEWSSLAVRKKVLDWKFWVVIWDMLRFNREVDKFLENDEEPELTLEKFLKDGGYSELFKDAYLLPMVAAVWSSPIARVMHFPARHLFQFFKNHGMTRVFGRPQWKTLSARSESYVKKVVEAIKMNGGEVRCNSRVNHVMRSEDGVRVVLANEDIIQGDKLILCTSASAALKILGDKATGEERRVLEACQGTVNEAFLHRDENLMPKDRENWSSWNFIHRFSRDGTVSNTQLVNRHVPVCATYWINLLENLDPVYPNLFETLNPTVPIDKSKIIKKLRYAHPQFTLATVRAQKVLPSMQGSNHTFFAGAWTKYGFHEDGLSSGLDVAELAAGCPLRPWLSKPALICTDNRKGYSFPSDSLFRLWVLTGAVEKVHEVLKTLVNRNTESDTGLLVCGHLGRLVSFGKRSAALLTVRSAKFYARIANTLGSENEFITNAILESFGAGEVDASSLEDLRAALVLLLGGEQAYWSEAKGKKSVLPEDPLSPLSPDQRILLNVATKFQFRRNAQEEGVRIMKSIPSDPEVSLVLREAFAPCWWDIGPDGQHGKAVLELFGGLEVTTLGHLKHVAGAKAVVVVETEEAKSHVLSKALNEDVSDQVEVQLCNEFLSDNASTFDRIISPVGANICERYWSSLNDFMMFLQSILKPDGLLELGFMCCADGSCRGLSHLARGESYRILNARSILIEGNALGLRVEGMRRMDAAEAADELRDTLNDLNLEPISVKDGRSIVRVLVQWEVALRLSILSRFVVILCKAAAEI